MTLAEVVDDARAVLQDRSAPYRYSDDDLVRYTQQAVDTAFRLRPDLAIGVVRPSYSTADMSAAIPEELARHYAAPLAEHVAAAAERRDSQFSEDARLVLLYSRFERALTAGGS